MRPQDVVIPSQAAELFGVSPELMRKWIQRKGVRPLGKLGRYNAYDLQDLAEVERDMRAR
ncbi:hypothetical protein [Microbispora sp. ATCC PTA-5024]|uniref:hypothetical protein n=1 Tax=Microbispora sp. ATCC PTA-5024 TaxID=316330 RepID=UPI0003DDC808|nr:hypothetical protein [Microbispora sp. ATCC PTA-5024]ETK36147.1 hypothetical protein MPTA5024_11010 [Microbispora sp. ATCC PTA-5024]